MSFYALVYMYGTFMCIVSTPCAHSLIACKLPVTKNDKYKSINISLQDLRGSCTFTFTVSGVTIWQGTLFIAF